MASLQANKAHAMARLGKALVSVLLRLCVDPRLTSGSYHQQVTTQAVLEPEHPTRYSKSSSTYQLTRGVSEAVTRRTSHIASTSDHLPSLAFPVTTGGAVW